MDGPSLVGNGSNWSGKLLLNSKGKSSSKFVKLSSKCVFKGKKWDVADTDPAISTPGKYNKSTSLSMSIHVLLSRK